MAIAELDFSLITKRKRMMDSVGHYSRPDLLQLQVNRDLRSVWHQTGVDPIKSQNNNDPTNDKAGVPEASKVNKEE
jgi:aliphatic nitrilase